MKASSVAPRLLPGLALGVLLALLIAPATSWLTRSQFVATLAGGNPLTSHGLTARQARAWHEAAARHPDDLQIQLVAVGPTEARIAYLHTLTDRFGDNPSLWANLLRYETQRDIHLDREESWLLSGRPVPPDFHASCPSPVLLARFDQDAAAGERVDPDNAFFPAMRAIGLFAAHRDDAALAAVLRAGDRPAWREYSPDEVYGQWRLSQEAFGGGDALSRAAVAAAVLFPDYVGLRGVARIATYQAMLAEQAGQVERGFEIRRALRRIGDKMRVQSTSYIGTLIGIAISAVAGARPGGAPALDSVPNVSGEDRSRHRLAAYTAYLRGIGHGDEADAAQAEDAASRQVRAIGTKALNRSAFGAQTLGTVMRWRLADLLLLSNLCWLLALGALAALLSRLPGVRGGGALPTPARLGAGLALVVAGMMAWFYASDIRGAFHTSFGLLFLIPAVLILFLLARHGGPAAARQGVGAFLITLVGVVGSGALAVRQAKELQDMVQFELVMFGSSEGPRIMALAPLELLLVLGVLTVPSLLLVVFIALTRACRRPLLFGVTHGLRAASLPVACGLVLVYGGLILGTLRQEKALDYAVRQSVTHDGQYFARLAGQPWPGPVP